MLLEYGLPMSRETCVAEDGILALYCFHLCRRYKNRNNNESPGNMLALNYSFKIKPFGAYFLRCSNRWRSWQSVKEYGT